MAAQEHFIATWLRPGQEQLGSVLQTLARTPEELADVLDNLDGWLDAVRLPMQRLSPIEDACEP